MKNDSALARFFIEFIPLVYLVFFKNKVDSGGLGVFQERGIY